MSAQRRTIGTIALAIALFLAAVLAVSVPPNIALALDCLTAPNSSRPPNSHWYYTTDRMQQRKCWHLRTDGAPSEQGVLRTAPEAPAKPTQSVAARHGGLKPSDQDVEKLYVEFLEWRRHTKN